MSRNDTYAKPANPSPVAMISSDHEKAVAYRSIARRFAASARAARKADAASRRAQSAKLRAEIEANNMLALIQRNY